MLMPHTQLPQELLELLAWFTPNETEAAFFAQGAHTGNSADMAQALMNKGPKGVLLKLGARGVFVATQTGVAEHLSSFEVKAVDTTAAGNAFNGAFATGLMMHLSPFDSARFAAAAAAISVTRPGAQPSMPSLTEVEQTLQNTINQGNGNS